MCKYIKRLLIRYSFFEMDNLGCRTKKKMGCDTIWENYKTFNKTKFIKYIDTHFIFKKWLLSFCNHTFSEINHWNIAGRMEM